MELEKFIKVFDNTVDPKVVGACIKYLSSVSFKDAGIIGPFNKDRIVKSIRNTQSWDFTSGTLTDAHWGNLWRYIIRGLFQQYTQSFDIFTGVSAEKIVTVNALKYEEGGFYLPHSDSHIQFPRTISIIYFLNNDYEGGDLVFHDPDRGGKEIKRIKAAPGRVVFWPSNFLYPHSVSKVTKGKRYTLVSWLA